jgi:uncharacterized protein DUF3617
MKVVARRRLAAAGSLLLAGSLAGIMADAPPAAPARGEQWEVVSQMSMEGMPMQLPPQKTTVCAAKEWKEPPGANDEKRKCKSSDFKMTGPKATWKVHCEGPPPMDGTGEITRDGADAFSGAIKFVTTEATMNIKLTGKRLGECDNPK